MTANNNHTDVLLEDINSKFDAILEAVGGMQDQVKRIPRMSERIEKLENDMSTIKLVAIATSSDTKLIKIRTEKLESILDDINDLQKRVKTIEAHA